MKGEKIGVACGSRDLEPPTAERPRKQLALLGKSAQRMRAERDQRSAIGEGKIVARHDLDR